MRNAALLALVLLASAPACAQPAAAPREQPAGVDLATARKIEAKVALPEGSRPLAAYARFYFVDEHTPAGMVSGWYVGVDDPPLPDWPRAGIHLKKPNIGVADGGCHVVSLTYDPAQDRIVSIRCNGQA